MYIMYILQEKLQNERPKPLASPHNSSTPDRPGLLRLEPRAQRIRRPEPGPWALPVDPEWPPAGGRFTKRVDYVTQTISSQAAFYSDIVVHWEFSSDIVVDFMKHSNQVENEAAHLPNCDDLQESQPLIQMFEYLPSDNATWHGTENHL